MFTGIIEELGAVKEISRADSGARIEIACRRVLEDASQGQSIAVNGVCLTVVTIGTESFAADVSSETLRRTSLGSLASGDPVNLERPLTPSARFGGHIVQGHVDGTGQLAGSREDDRGAGYIVTIRFGAELGRYIVEKGSIAVDGISLTVASLGDDSFDVAVIPHTWRVTNLSSLTTGSPVNLEVDIIAKYVERLLAHDTPVRAEGLTLEKLKDLGY